MNAQASALRFFFTIILGRADLASVGPHYPRKTAMGPYIRSRPTADRDRARCPCAQRGLEAPSGVDVDAIGELLDL
jgi:hypothetical protein